MGGVVFGNVAFEVDEEVLVLEFAWVGEDVFAVAADGVGRGFDGPGCWGRHAGDLDFAWVLEDCVRFGGVVVVIVVG